MQDDLIDFKCSDSWLGYYTEMGMTKRGWPRPHEERTAPVTLRSILARSNEPDLPNEAVRMIRELRGRVAALTLENEILKQKAKPGPVVEAAGVRLLPESETINDAVA